MTGGRGAKLFVVAALGGLLFPFVPLILWSFVRRWPWPDLAPATLGTQAWGTVLAPSSRVLEATLTSCVLAGGVTVVVVLISLPASRVLAREQFFGKSVVDALVLAPVLVPGYVSAMGLQQVFLRLGLQDTLWGVGLAHLFPTMPYMMRALTAAYTTMGTRLEDQARTLGADAGQVFWGVTLPRLAPALTAGAVFVFLASNGQYLLTLLLDGGHVQTLPLVLYPLIMSGDRALAAAASLMLALPALVFVWLLEGSVRKAYEGAGP